MPLAGQRTLLQVALADPDADAQALRSTCEKALQLSGQQERLIDALLTLASSERGVEAWEPFDLAQLTHDIVHSRQHDAERHGVRIGTTLQSADRLFQPFQRVGEQRVGRADGHGLGLAIVKAIATAHSANLTAHPRPRGGLDVQVTFRAKT